MTIEVIETGGAEQQSAVSVRAIVAGALVAIAATVVLVTLGSGFGFAAASPWGDAGQTAAKLGVAAGIWLIMVQWLSSALGGYLTGRLRVRWTGIHSHEAFFRDTAHGLLAWALATAIMSAVAAATALGGAGGAATAGVAGGAQALAYDADVLYRAPAGDEAALAPGRAEAVRLLAAAGGQGALSPDDQAYLAQSIQARTGVAAPEAQARVAIVLQRERQAAADAQNAADQARKAASTLAILTALSMVIGALIAAAAAALGGHLRDERIAGIGRGEEMRTTL